MFLFPLVSIIGLIILYRIHRKIFYIASVIDMITYIIGVYYIESSFSQTGNQILYYLWLTGLGLIIVVLAFFIAITLNHRHLYTDTHE